MHNIFADFDQILETEQSKATTPFDIGNLPIPPVEWLKKIGVIGDRGQVNLYLLYTTFYKKFYFNKPDMSDDEFKTEMNNVLKDISGDPNANIIDLRKYFNDIVPGSKEYFDEIHNRIISDYQPNDPGFIDNANELKEDWDKRAAELAENDPCAWISHYADPNWPESMDVRFNGGSKMLYVRIIKKIEKDLGIEIPNSVKKWVVNYKK